MRICVYAEHTTLAGRVYTGDDIESNDDIECYERESRIGLIIMAAEWASRSGAANAHTIRCGRNILDHLGVVDEDIALGIIHDLELATSTQSGEPDYPQPSEPATAPTHASDAVERAGDDQ